MPIGPPRPATPYHWHFAFPARTMPAAKKKLASFKTLPAFQLEMLAALVASRNELRHQRRFGLRSVECHILGIVGAQAPISLRKLCAELGLDKSHGSRLVARLEERGLLERCDDPADKRSFYLLLTPQGMDMHARIHADAVERNAEWLEGLPAARRGVFMDCIAQLTAHSQAMLAQEEAAAGQPPAPRQDAGDTIETRGLLLVERAKLQQLHEQLAELLGRS
ncbi:MarR family winged helix-turn-helix transcriptional regulator [Pigmentiphaga sp. NML080357]|uniref:MarR family winged helix-turn-helix transcriptional regulator n=1 Tax=Pigmentiphaga sp. NML080357 TaxID=2008675 RepID=UPI001303E2B0|nr:MarR family winged helix-turn-helix transcriptional regulator [Pigmentiphaga sp. NML080357]